MKTFTLLCVAFASSLQVVSAQAASDLELAEQGYAILKQYCHRCHGVNFAVDGLDVLDHEGLLKDRGPQRDPWVTPGNPEASPIWDRVGVRQDMPPDEAAQPTDAEREILKQWIAAGAKFPVREERAFATEESILRPIRDHLKATPKEDRQFQRYLSLHALFNNHKQVTIDELRLGRAALSKLVNSLSWKDKIVPPLALDASQTVFNIDLRNYGWDKKDLWNEVVKVYPYGMNLSAHRDDSVRRLASEIRQLSGDDLAYVRADWFIATASRPPLYHTMLELPENIKELRAKLNVFPKEDFMDNSLARAGLITSKVSKQNRLLDRHSSLYGYYWESYDFKQNDGTGDLQQFPLGPKFDNHPFVFQAFEHDGGEMIFSLPNGLQGYYLSDAKGNRINEGPIQIVRDSLETSGTPVIVNGLSCMSCHSRGVVRFEAEAALRDNTPFSGTVRDKVQKLYKHQSEFDEMMAKDEARFLAAVEAAAGQYLQVEGDAGKSIGDFKEPIGTIARWYIRDLSPEVVAGEMGIENPAEIPAIVKGNPNLRKAGLAPLGTGGTIKRDVWGNQNENSPYFQFARALELGEPLIAKVEKKIADVAQTVAKAVEKADAKAKANPQVKSIKAKAKQ
ncbi:MAG: c-type cytochrome domain-containing protein [Pirellulales bacterium]